MIWSSVKKNVSLKPHTSWLVGGPAEFFYEPKSPHELKTVCQEAREKSLPVTVLGGGTNLLISDAGIRGLVISLNLLKEIRVVSESPNLELECLSGAPKSELLKILLKYKLAPAAFLAGLPGQVGGGVVMNAGVSENLVPREFCEIVSRVEVLRPNGRFESMEGKQLRWNYRHCSGWEPGIVSRVWITCFNSPDPGILDQVKLLNRNRLHKQPLDKPSCGSVFRNPLPHRAGELIEKAGLKGLSIGGAQISPKHANFIVNLGDATAADILTLIEKAQTTVKEKFQVALVTEVVKLGF